MSNHVAYDIVQECLDDLTDSEAEDIICTLLIQRRWPGSYYSRIDVENVWRDLVSGYIDTTDMDMPDEVWEAVASMADFVNISTDMWNSSRDQLIDCVDKGIRAVVMKSLA